MMALYFDLLVMEVKLKFKNYTVTNGESDVEWQMMVTYFSVLYICGLFMFYFFTGDNPCQEGVPYKVNDDAVTCSKNKRCPTGHVCTTGDNYAVCCPSKTISS